MLERGPEIAHTEHTKRGCAHAQPHNESFSIEISQVSFKRFVAVSCKLKRPKRRELLFPDYVHPTSLLQPIRCRKLYQIPSSGCKLIFRYKYMSKKQKLTSKQFSLRGIVFDFRATFCGCPVFNVSLCPLKGRKYLAYRLFHRQLLMNCRKVKGGEWRQLFPKERKTQECKANIFQTLLSNYGTAMNMFSFRFTRASEGKNIRKRYIG